MENRTLLYTVSSRYAISFGAYFIAVFTLMNFILRTGQASFIPLFMLIAIPVLCYFYTKTYRDKYAGGHITFLHSWMFNVMLFMLAGLLFAFYLYLYIRFIQPDYVNWVLEISKQSIGQLMQTLPNGSGGTDLEAWLKQLEELNPPTAIEMAISSMGSIFYGGFFVSLFIALFTKKNPLPTVDQNTGTES